MNKELTEMYKIARESARKAQQKSLERGIPNVYSKNGKIYFQMPDGTITDKTPKEYQKEA